MRSSHLGQASPEGRRRSYSFSATVRSDIRSQKLRQALRNSTAALDPRITFLPLHSRLQPSVKIISFSHSQMRSPSLTPHPTNAPLQGRGLLGTHETDHGITLLWQLREPSKSTTTPRKIVFPSFNKNIHNGAGDRLPNGTNTSGCGHFGGLVLPLTQKETRKKDCSIEVKEPGLSRVTCAEGRLSDKIDTFFPVFIATTTGAR